MRAGCEPGASRVRAGCEPGARSRMRRRPAPPYAGLAFVTWLGRAGTACAYGQYGAPSLSVAVVAAVPTAMWQPEGLPPTRPVWVAVADQPVAEAAPIEYDTPCDGLNCVVLIVVV